MGFDRTEVLERGEVLEPVPVGGVSIPAVAAGSVVAYLHESDPRLSITVTPRAGVRFPVAEGAPLGEARVRVRGRDVGSVPVVVGDLPPTPGEGRPFWLRVTYVLLAVLGDLAIDTATRSA